MSFKFLDYIYYRVYKAYESWGDTGISPDIYAMAVATLFPLINLISLIFFAFAILHLKILHYNKWLILLCYLGAVILNNYRIHKIIGVSRLFDQWDNADKKTKDKYGIWMVVYFILSIIVVFISILIPL